MQPRLKKVEAREAINQMQVPERHSPKLRTECGLDLGGSADGQNGGTLAHGMSGQGRNYRLRWGLCRRTALTNACGAVNAFARGVSSPPRRP